MKNLIIWLNNLSGTDYIDITMLILTIVGGMFALIQWNEANKTRRAEFVNRLVEKMRDDEDIVKITHMFDYNFNWYNDKFQDSELEDKVDKTLSFFSYICYLRKNNIIGKKDFDFFNYDIQRIANNASIQAYFFNIYNFANRQNAEMSFCYLFNYCCEHKLFGEEVNEIKNPKSKLYPKYLNF